MRWCFLPEEDGGLEGRGGQTRERRGHQGKEWANREAIGHGARTGQSGDEGGSDRRGGQWRERRNGREVERASRETGRGDREG